MKMPALCGHHVDVYATKAARLRRRHVHHPGAWRALVEEARTIARQCPTCPTPTKRTHR